MGDPLVEKPTKLISCQEVLESVDLFRERPGAVSIHSMAEDVDAVSTEDTLGLFDDETVLGEAFEERTKVGLVFHLVFAGDEDVVEIDKDVLEALRDPIHETRPCWQSKAEAI